MLRKDRIGGVMIAMLGLAPCVPTFMLVVHAPPVQRANAIAFFLLSAMWPASILWIVPLAFDRRGRGLVLRAIRGGPEPVIEVRARCGVGGGLRLPLVDARSTQNVYRMGQKRMVIAEASTSTAIGDVAFARGGTTLDRELVDWIDAVIALVGQAEPGEGVADPEAIAAAARRDPLAAPPPIEATLVNGWPTWRYRSVPGAERSAILSQMALFGVWMAVFPPLGIFEAGPLAAFVVPVELVLAYLLLHSGAMMEFQVRTSMLVSRRKRFGLTLSIGVSEAALAGIDTVALPKVSLTFGRKRRGETSPLAGGPDMVAMAWLSAAIRACASA